MQLAILHYHLNRGGVTQVIRNQLRSLASIGCQSVERIAVLYGGRREASSKSIETLGNPLHVESVPVDSLEYDDPGQPARSAVGSLVSDLRAALDRLRMGPSDTLLHVHNHALGKNAALPAALAELARDGYRLLLEIHDFVEDFRPDNYRHVYAALGATSAGDLAGRLYPQALNVHYAVLNRRDLRILEQVLPDPRRVHWLPNPIADPFELPSPDVARRKLQAQFGVSHDVPIVVFPVRGIRRKNVGEMLLWSALLGPTAVFAITLRPINPEERGPFDRWVALARELGLGCRFGTGEATSPTYPENLAASDLLLTTSIAEGFGMVFLEASLIGRPLIGRDLPEITDDFREAGVRFGWLGGGLAVPAECLDLDQVRRGLVDAYLEVQAAYGRPQERTATEDRAGRILDRRHVDFALLTPRLQADLVRRTRELPDVRDALLSANDHVLRLPDRHERVAAAELVHNRGVIEQRFGLVASGQRLARLYETVMSSPPGEVAPLAGGEGILDAFLDLTRLHPVRLAK